MKVVFVNCAVRLRSRVFLSFYGIESWRWRGGLLSPLPWEKQAFKHMSP